jgi:hypothetical protein
MESVSIVLTLFVSLRPPLAPEAKAFLFYFSGLWMVLAKNTSQIKEGFKLDTSTGTHSWMQSYVLKLHKCGVVCCGCGCVWVRVSTGVFLCMGVLCACTCTNGTSQFERKSYKFSRGNLTKYGEQYRKLSWYLDHSPTSNFGQPKVANVFTTLKKWKKKENFFRTSSNG